MASPVQVTPKIYQITRGANIFLLKLSDDTLAIVDTGIPGATKMILAAAQHLGYAAHQIRHILITHADIDHVGSLSGLVQATGAQVYASVQSTPFIENVQSPPHLSGFFASIAGLMQKLTQKKAPVHHQLYDGQVLDLGGGIQAMHAPGHTPDNFCFYWQSERVLFAPDLLNRLRGPLSVSPPVISWDVEAVKKSAANVLTLDTDVICVGHGNFVTQQAHGDEIEALKKQLG